MTAEQKLANIKRIFETRRKNVTTHAWLNLEGAICDIGHNARHCGKVTLNTLNRVSKQLARIAKVLEL